MKKSQIILYLAIGITKTYVPIYITEIAAAYQLYRGRSSTSLNVVLASHSVSRIKERLCPAKNRSFLEF